MFRARFGRLVPPSSSEGAGNAGRPMRPIAACAEVVFVSTRVVRSHRKSPGIPRAMVYGLFRALPGDRAFLPPSLAKMTSTNLIPASGHQDHATSPSASSAVRQERQRVHRILSRVRDDLEPPLCGTGREGYKGDLVFRKTRIFLRKGLDRQISDLPDGSLTDEIRTLSGASCRRIFKPKSDRLHRDATYDRRHRQ
jgi:hypothetical protein